MTVCRPRIMLPILNSAAALGIVVYGTAVADNTPAGPAGVRPVVVFCYWFNAPALLLRNLTVSAVDRLLAFAGIDASPWSIRGVYVGLFLIFVVIVWFVVGSMIESWGRPRPHRTFRKTILRVLADIALVSLAILVALAGKQGVHNRHLSSYSSVSGFWTLVHDVIFGIWVVAILLPVGQHILQSVCTRPGNNPAR